MSVDRVHKHSKFALGLNKMVKKCSTRHEPVVCYPVSFVCFAVLVVCYSVPSFTVLLGSCVIKTFFMCYSDFQ